MPNRIIKESICTSPTLAGLSAEAERFFYRLLVKCDDYGRYHGDEQILLGACFPLLIEKIKPNHVRAWITELEKAGLVIRYMVDDRRYLYIPTWKKHQNIRAKESKFPEPPPLVDKSVDNSNQTLAGDRICDQTQADAPVFGSRIRISYSDDHDHPGSSSPSGDDVDKTVDKSKPQKKRFAEFVTMTEEEYAKLVADYGEELTRRSIEILDNYKGSTGKRYKSDYRTILNWVISRAQKERAEGLTPPSKPRKEVKLPPCGCRAGLRAVKDEQGRVEALVCQKCGQLQVKYDEHN